MEYQKYVAKTKELESKTNNTSLIDEFNQQYESLFMEHLKEVLSKNIISLEIQKATLTSIITQTEQHLASSCLSQEEIKKMFHKFL